MNVLNSWLSLAWFRAYGRIPSNSNGRFRHYSIRLCKASPLFAVVFIAGIFGVFSTLVMVFWRGWGAALPPRPPPPPLPTGTRTFVDQLYDRQSYDLEQAVARYVLRNERSPPKKYDQWFAFAKDHGCLIDEYDQIARDFAPFYQLAKQDPKFFKKMVERGSKLAIAENLGIKTFKVKGGVPSMTDDRASNYDGGWMLMLRNISASLPNINLVINHRDEPRVAFDARVPLAQNGALELKDTVPFLNQPRPTSKFYTDEKHCLFPNTDKGFLTYANDDNSFLMYSASADFTTDLYPVLSQTKIYPCFSDIVFPSEFHYPRAYNSPKYSFSDNIPWNAKKPVLYWRGQSTGGWISGTNYHGFPRFKLLDIARDHADIMDVAISAFYEHFCQLEGCDADRIKAEYNITGVGSAREDVYNYKYVFDVDGNSFSGRYLGLLKSGSLVFKSTIFHEYFDDWLKPFVHYIPVLPDLSDLVDRIEWARTHDAEARRIQAAGKEFVERVITDAQNDCYWYLVLLEWARLQNG
ncbi:glycosyl transferase family 90-domain-containing protein [Mycena leptocephala]|nr:glycosyl transferase family 90-domain-containing protein [Mycena leptocephala]